MLREREEFPRDESDSRLRVSLFGPCLMGGGAEEWQKLLMMSVDATRINIIGAGIPCSNNIRDGAAQWFRSRVPVVSGTSACRRLSHGSDLALCWMLAQPDRILSRTQSPRPVMVACSHTDTVTQHDMEVHRWPWDHLAAVSSQATACLPPGRLAQVRILPNAMDLSKLQVTMPPREVRKSLGLPDGAKVLGFVGRPDSAQKDPQALARAVPFLPDSWVAVFLGDWYGHAQAWDEIRAMVPGRCFFPGHRADIGNYMNIFERIVIPSRWESCCIVALEAAAFGVPIVGTTCGVLEDDPWMARAIPKDAPGEVLARAVLDDLADPVGSRRRAWKARAKVLGTRSLTTFGMAWTEYLIECFNVSRKAAGFWNQ